MNEGADGKTVYSSDVFIAIGSTYFSIHSMGLI